MIVPKPFGAGVACGDDSFDEDVLDLDEDFDEFLGQAGRQVSDEVIHFRLRSAFLPKPAEVDNPRKLILLVDTDSTVLWSAEPAFVALHAACL